MPPIDPAGKFACTQDQACEQQIGRNQCRRQANKPAHHFSWLSEGQAIFLTFPPTGSRTQNPQKVPARSIEPILNARTLRPDCVAQSSPGKCLQPLKYVNQRTAQGAKRILGGPHMHIGLWLG